MTDKRALGLAEFYGIEVGQYLGFDTTNNHILRFNPFGANVSQGNADLMIGMITRGVVAQGFLIRVGQNKFSGKICTSVEIENEVGDIVGHSEGDENVLWAVSEAAYQAMEEAK